MAGCRLTCTIDLYQQRYGLLVLAVGGDKGTLYLCSGCNPPHCCCCEESWICATFEYASFTNM